MTVKVIAPVFAAMALAFAAPAHAACDGLEGKELKKCEKAAAAQAKADARSTPYVPSVLDKALAGWDAEDKNPFATDAYRVRITSTELAPADDYLAKAFRIQAIVVASKFVVDEIGKGNADAAKAAPALVPLLAEVPELGKQIATEGQGLITTLKDQVEPADVMKVPKAAAALKDAVTALQTSVETAPDVLASLKAAIENPANIAGAAAGAAASEVAE